MSKRLDRLEQGLRSIELDLNTHMQVGKHLPEKYVECDGCGALVNREKAWAERSIVKRQPGVRESDYSVKTLYKCVKCHSSNES